MFKRVIRQAQWAGYRRTTSGVLFRRSGLTSFPQTSVRSLSSPPSNGSNGSKRDTNGGIADRMVAALDNARDTMKKSLIGMEDKVDEIMDYAREKIGVEVIKKGHEKFEDTAEDMKNIKGRMDEAVKSAINDVTNGPDTVRERAERTTKAMNGNITTENLSSEAQSALAKLTEIGSVSEASSDPAEAMREMADDVTDTPKNNASHSDKGFEQNSNDVTDAAEEGAYGVSRETTGGIVTDDMRGVTENATADAVKQEPFEKASNDATDAAEEGAYGVSKEGFKAQAARPDPGGASMNVHSGTLKAAAAVPNGMGGDMGGTGGGSVGGGDVAGVHSSAKSSGAQGGIGSESLW